jgi:predicted ATPase
MDYTAVGQTTHLAARMEQMAMPGAILITPAVLRLVEGFVQITALGTMPVRGLRDPVEVYEVTGASVVRSRLQVAAAARGLTRFVGRQQELLALQQALQQAGAGHGQVVALVGEPGVGKSRLVYEFVHSHYTPGWLVLESASVSYGKATPYFPVIDLLKRYSHVDDGDDTRTIRAKVTGQVLTLDETLQDAVPALLSLLDALPEDNAFVQLDPPQRRQRTLDALKRVVLRESQVQPLLLVFEDLHWIDSETQALLDSLVASLPTARLLLLVNYRPEYQHGWGNKTYYTQLRLDPLPPVSADALLQALLGDDASLAPLTPLLIPRTEGNPFFLEESVRTLVETGLLVGAPGAYRLAQPLDTFQVPATVQAVLAARIDRLPPEEKRLLQTAAVIGTEVPMPVLQAIAELPEAAFHHGLAHLQAAEFLYETRLFPEHAYTFKHALTHEVAYGGLLQERRRVLHARIVEVLETLAGDRVTEQVERLAHHALRGELWAKALTYCWQAGDKALTRSANREGVACFEQALAALQHLPESRATREQAIDLHLALGLALQQRGEPAQKLDHLRAAETLAEALHDQRRLGRIYSAMTNTLWGMGDNACALAYGQRALALAATLGDFRLQAEANFFLGQVYYGLGDYRQAMDLLRQNVASLQGDLLQERTGTPGPTAAFSRARLVWCLAEVGEFPEGMVRSAEAIRIAEASNYPYCLIAVHFAAGYLYLRQGDLPQAISMFERCVALSQDLHLPAWFSASISILGYGYALEGRAAEAVLLLEQAREHAAAGRFVSFHSATIAWQSESALLVGRLDDALTLAEQALAMYRKRKERGHEAWALRLLGDIATQRQPPEVETAEASYRQALALAEELGMRPLQAHCHRSLGTLYAATGQREPARTELSTAIALYHDMEMTFWLPQTEAALAQVEGP